jgi:hypothetical protein
MYRFGLFNIIAVWACMLGGGCGWKYHMVEATVTDPRTGMPTAGATVYANYPLILPYTPARVSGVTDEDGRVKLTLADCGARLHVCSSGDHSALVIKGYKPWLWKQSTAGTRFDVEGTPIREGGCLPYKPDLNENRPLPKHAVTFTPTPPKSALGRLMLRLGFIQVKSFGVATVFD